MPETATVEQTPITSQEAYGNARRHLAECIIQGVQKVYREESHSDRDQLLQLIRSVTPHTNFFKNARGGMLTIAGKNVHVAGLAETYGAFAANREKAVTEMYPTDEWGNTEVLNTIEKICETDNAYFASAIQASLSEQNYGLETNQVAEKARQVSNRIRESRTWRWYTSQPPLIRALLTAGVAAAAVTTALALGAQMTAFGLAGLAAKTFLVRFGASLSSSTVIATALGWGTQKLADVFGTAGLEEYSVAGVEQRMFTNRARRRGAAGVAGTIGIGIGIATGIGTRAFLSDLCVGTTGTAAPVAETVAAPNCAPEIVPPPPHIPESTEIVDKHIRVIPRPEPQPEIAQHIPKPTPPVEHHEVPPQEPPVEKVKLTPPPEPHTPDTCPVDGTLLDGKEVGTYHANGTVGYPDWRHPLPNGEVPIKQVDVYAVIGDDKGDAVRDGWQAAHDHKDAVIHMYHRDADGCLHYDGCYEPGAVDASHGTGPGIHRHDPGTTRTWNPETDDTNHNGKIDADEWKTVPRGNGHEGVEGAGQLDAHLQRAHITEFTKVD